MGTRSRIGYQLKSGNIVSVYHHWDSYPTWLGKRLTTNYTTDKEITELIDGGDMSSIESDRDWDRNTVPTHVQYYSQRGDTECEPLLHKNQREFIKTTGDCWGEYSYLYRNGRWFCYDEKGKSVSLKNL
jgi:hypothetical protein